MQLWSAKESVWEKPLVMALWRNSGTQSIKRKNMDLAKGFSACKMLWHSCSRNKFNKLKQKVSIQFSFNCVALLAMDTDTKRLYTVEIQVTGRNLERNQILKRTNPRLGDRLFDYRSHHFSNCNLCILFHRIDLNVLFHLAWVTFLQGKLCKEPI